MYSEEKLMPLRIRKRKTSDNTKVRVVRRKNKRADMSRQAEDIDGFTDSVTQGTILATPYSIQSLSSLFEQSNILRQCIEAMTTNIVRYGYRAVPMVEGMEVKEEEKNLLESFIESPNTEESLVGIQSKKTTDYEKYGFGFIEVIRNARGKPSLLRHAKSYNIRLMKKIGDPVPIVTSVVRGGTRSKITEYKRFRRYVQSYGTVKTYYKEFGDPRDMDYRTGRYAGDDAKVQKKYKATELLHEHQYSEDSYGLPRWISQMPSILGSREAEEVNMRYFEDNTVPPMIMSVAGGRLTRQSFQDLNKLLQGDGVGKERQNQIMLIEAIPETTGLDEKGSVTLQIERLSDVRPSDGLFKEYDDANMAKVMSSFRLSPVVIGMSQNINFATANVAAYLAESQVFMPERQTHDEFFNKNFVNHPNGLNLMTVKVETKGPSVTNPDQVIKTLTAVNVMGGVTPRMAIEVTNETMQLSLTQYPEEGEEGYEEWMDMPMVLSQKILGASQQTGEGEKEDDEQAQKDTDIKDRESNGETGVGEKAAEHGSE